MKDQIMPKVGSTVLVKFSKLKPKEAGYILEGKTDNGVEVFMKPENISSRFERDMIDKKKSYLLASFLGDVKKVKVMEIVEGKLEVSIKEITMKTVSKMVKDFEKDPEKKYKAVVKKPVDTGTIMEIAGVDCFMGNREFSDNKAVFSKDFLKPGEIVEVKMLTIKEDKINVQRFEKYIVPESEFKAFGEDEIVVGKVMQIKEFGAFVQLEKGVDAICSIPEYQYDNVSVGDNVTIRITKINGTKNIRAKFMFKHV